MILLFFILDTVRLSYFWIKKLRTSHPLLADKTTLTDADFQTFNDIQTSTSTISITSPLSTISTTTTISITSPLSTITTATTTTSTTSTASNTSHLKSLEEIVDLVAERTLVVDKLIYFPMLCIMLMLFAKITYFDNQEFPLSKGITFAASISLLFYAGFMLRKEAEELRLCVIRSAENLVKDKIILGQKEVDAVINKIKNINKGAFEPMFEQPVMRALLIILASIGIFAAKYLKIFE